VVFEDVSFAYEPRTTSAQAVSLHAQPGQIVALVGPDGAGKTTIVNLLTRFYEIDSGRIAIDGVDIRQIKTADLRRQLGIVLQDTYLFTGTVMENIRYGRLDASDDEVIAAARLANADPFIHRLPQGYATLLSERGSNLSQGQRQLLAIARAILADPGILILDEATSSVDTRTEQHIQEAMLRLMQGRTSFVIAHRLSTIRAPTRFWSARRRNRRTRQARRTAGAARLLPCVVHKPVSRARLSDGASCVGIIHNDTDFCIPFVGS
jgi:ATP-binding cassette subfamily B multidrug efflux pump